VNSMEIRFGREETVRERSRQVRGRGIRGGVSDGLPESFEEEKKEKKRVKRQDAKATKIGSKNRAEMRANARKRVLKTLTNRAADIKKLNKSDIRQVRSLANQAASDYQAPKIKDLIKNTAQKTSASRSLLSTVARGAGLVGAGIMMSELVRVHNQIKKNPDTRYGSTSLFKILTK